MVTSRVRAVVATGSAVVALLGAVGCGQGGAGKGVARDRPSSPSSAPRTVFLSSSARAVPRAHEVLRDRAQVERFAGRFDARDASAAEGIRAAGRAADFSRSVLVGWTATTGCGAATSARLEVAGERLALRVVTPSAAPECFAAYRVTAVFEVARERVPAEPVFADGS
jgi:hypothetical protein